MKIFKRYFLILIYFSFIGCKEKEVIITKDYVINPYWDETDNSFIVAKMKFKDSSKKNLKLNNVTSQKLLSDLVKDTTFSFTANVMYNNKSYAERKIYFNRDNDFLWRKPPNVDPSRNITFKTIGELEKSSWYFLGGLDKEKILYYVYIDSLDKLHTFKISSTSWTNY